MDLLLGLGTSEEGNFIVKSVLKMNFHKKKKKGVEVLIHEKENKLVCQQCIYNVYINFTKKG